MTSVRLPLPVCLSAFLSLASAAFSQTFQATCDNRTGTTTAGLGIVRPTVNGYAIDSSDLYTTINGIAYPAVQSSGANSASASLTVISKFIGALPAVQCTGFYAHVTGSASVNAGTVAATASSSDTQSFCLTLSGASTAHPAFFRLVAYQTTSGSSATGYISYAAPGALTTTIPAGLSLNKPRKLTIDGDYRITAHIETGTLSQAAGTGSARAGISTDIAYVCLADYNGNGSIGVDDIFGFLRAWFAKDQSADSNVDGNITVDDIFGFLRAWFSHCS